jgi:arsenical pump membrane protein
VQWAELFERVGPILGFLVCITVVAELSDKIGVFSTIAHGAARVAGGSVIRLWLFVVGVAVISTTVLSLDTTAVLITPVALALAGQLDLDRRLFAYTTVWLANTASMLLPVSNLTNLLAVGVLPGVDALSFARLMWPAALTAAVVTVLVLMIIFRRSLRGRYERAAREPVDHRGLLILAMIVCALLGPAFLLGVDVLVARRLLPWQLVLGVAVLFVIIQLAHDHGLGTALARAAGSGESWPALIRLTGLGAGGANVIDNLPAYLALEPTASGSPVRVAALLVGVNAGPLITPWASLATLLWAARCRSAGLTVSWGPFLLRGLLLVPLLMATSVTAVWLVHG